MVVINAITGAWVNSIGGADTIYNLLALMFIYTIVYIFFKIST